jgi:hypothetical protein
MMSTFGEDALADVLVLAAVERAERHAGRDTPGVPVLQVLAHLEIASRSRRARDVRARVDALARAGQLERTRRHGVAVWALTSTGRRRLARARRTGALPGLPESPQHRAWREARAAAVAGIDGLREQLRGALGEAVGLLDTEGSLRMRGLSGASSCGGCPDTWPRRPIACGSGLSPTMPRPMSMTTATLAMSSLTPTGARICAFYARAGAAHGSGPAPRTSDRLPHGRPPDHMRGVFAGAKASRAGDHEEHPEQRTAPRVQSGTLANVESVDGRSEIAVKTRDALERTVHVDTAEFNDLRVAYAPTRSTKPRARPTAAEQWELVRALVA